jgi:hypothetical protein
MDANVAVIKFFTADITPFYEKYKIEYGTGLYTLYLCLRGTSLE